MFESVDALSRRLRQTPLTGDPQMDYRAREDIIAHARQMQNEAVRCLLRAGLAPFRRGWWRLVRSLDVPTMHQT